MVVQVFLIGALYHVSFSLQGWDVLRKTVYAISPFLRIYRSRIGWVQIAGHSGKSTACCKRWWCKIAKYFSWLPHVDVLRVLNSSRSASAQCLSSVSMWVCFSNHPWWRINSQCHESLCKRFLRVHWSFWPRCSSCWLRVCSLTHSFGVVVTSVALGVKLVDIDVVNENILESIRLTPVIGLMSIILVLGRARLVWLHPLTHMFHCCASMLVGSFHSRPEFDEDRSMWEKQGASVRELKMMS